MNGRADVVRLLPARGADVTDKAFDHTGPTPLDRALWGVRHNRAADGDYAATVAALIAVNAPTSHDAPTGDAGVDAVMAQRSP
ncbi:hypothetical protein ACFXGA_06550 [Actinosynnema sp. NPDC059335]|uniref:hypothetical protein n=1 Tax=Actinosynnema sp. NPDC059335 TaxID=3346804 RepID=UPI00366E2BAA